MIYAGGDVELWSKQAFSFISENKLFTKGSLNVKKKEKKWENTQGDPATPQETTTN